MRSPEERENQTKRNREDYIKQNRVRDKRVIVWGVIGVVIGGISLFVMYCVKHYELLK